jgi:serine/threonine-protein kinase SRK2
VDEIMKIVGEAREPPPVSRPVKGFGWEGEEEEEDVEEEVEEEEDEEDEYDKRVKEVHASGEFQIS